MEFFWQQVETGWKEEWANEFSNFCFIPTFVDKTIRPRVIRGMASFRPSKTMGKETEVALVPPLMELHPWRWLYTRPPPCSKSILLVFRGGGRSDLKKETKDCKIFRRMYRLEKEGRGVIYFCW